MASKIDDAITTLVTQAEISNSWGNKKDFQDKFQKVMEDLKPTELLTVTEELLDRHSKSLGDFGKLVGEVHNKLSEEEKANSSFIGDAIREKEEAAAQDAKIKASLAAKAEAEAEKAEAYKESLRKYAIIAEFSNIPLNEKLEKSHIFRENIDAADKELTHGYTDEKILNIRIETKSKESEKYFEDLTPLSKKGLEDSIAIYKLENIISNTVEKGHATQKEKHAIKSLVSNLVKDDPELSTLVNKHIGKVVRDAFEENEIKVEQGIAQNLSDKLRNKDDLEALKEGLKEKGLDLEAMVKKMIGGLAKGEPSSAVAPTAKGASKGSGMGM